MLREERFAYREPFRIAGHLFTQTAVLVAEISVGPHTGRGEGAGVYYLGDDLTHMGLPGLDLPSLGEVIELTAWLGRRTNPAIRCAGISLNTSALTDLDAAEAIFEVGAATGFPAADPLRGGAAFDRLVDSCLA